MDPVEFEAYIKSLPIQLCAPEFRNAYATIKNYANRIPNQEYIDALAVTRLLKAARTPGVSFMPAGSSGRGALVHFVTSFVTRFVTGSGIFVTGCCASSSSRICGQYVTAEIQGLENFADRKKVVTEWLHNDEESYDTLADFFERLFVREDGKTQAILAYFRELYGVDEEEQPTDHSEAATAGAYNVTGENATVIGQQNVGLNAEFVQDLLAAKDKQINRLLDILAKTNGQAAE